jgi:hypothetical protein
MLSPRNAIHLALAAAGGAFCLLLRPPVEADGGGRLYASVLGLLSLLLGIVPGLLLLWRFPGRRYWIVWGAASIAALAALGLSLATYYDVRASYSVDHEGTRLVVGDVGDLTDLGRLHREVKPQATAEELVRLAAGQPHLVWKPEALHGHARVIERYYFLSCALAGAAAIGLVGAWRSRSRADAEAPAAARTAAEAPATTAAPVRRFRVALSFPGEVRRRAEAIATAMEPALGRDRIFYDRWYAAELARPDMDLHLQGIYRNDSDLLVVLLCAEYHRKEWCGLEWRVVRELVKTRASDRIMFLRLDSAPLEGLLSIDGYLDVVDMDDDEVAAAILSRASSAIPGA